MAISPLKTSVIFHVSQYTKFLNALNLMNKPHAYSKSKFK